MPRLAAHLSLRANLQVTSGVARAVYLKGGSCPAFPQDVIGDQCTGYCTVDWLTRFNPYDGTPITKQSANPLVPNGMGPMPALCSSRPAARCGLVCRCAGAPGTEAEFAAAQCSETPPQEVEHECDPNAPECRPPIPADAGRDSAAVPRATAGRTTAVMLGCAVAAGMMLAGAEGQYRRGGR